MYNRSGTILDERGKTRYTVARVKGALLHDGGKPETNIIQIGETANCNNKLDTPW